MSFTSSAVLVVLTFCIAVAAGLSCDSVDIPSNPISPLANSSILLGWGANANSQLGTQRGNPAIVLAPSYVQMTSATSPQYTSISAGLGHTVGIASGKLFAAGSGLDGQLGVGPAGVVAKSAVFNPWEQFLVGNVLNSFSGYTVLSAAAGWYHTCAVMMPPSESVSKVFCSGRNKEGQLGNQVITKTIPYPIAVNGSSEFAAANIDRIVASADFTVALGNDATELWAWGEGASGELGNGAAKATNYPVKVTGITLGAGERISHFDCGFRFCVALTSANKLYGWGLNDASQLGGVSDEHNSTSAVLIKTGVTQMAAGGSHVLAVVDGALHSWGEGTMGQTGQPKTLPEDMLEAWEIATPTPIAEFADVNIHSIAAGMRHSLVLDKCGNVYSFGATALGQLGTGTEGSFKARFREHFYQNVTTLAKRGIYSKTLYSGPFDSYVVGG